MPFPAVLAALGRGAGGMGSLYKGMNNFGARNGLYKNTGQNGGGVGFAGNTNPKNEKEPKPKKEPSFFDRFKESLHSAQDAISKSFSSLVKNITSPIDGINALGQSIAKFTSLSSPGKTALFDLRIKDAYAVVGKAMEPLLDSFTGVAERIGDMFARSSPQLKMLFSTIGKSFELLGAIVVKFEPIFNAAVLFVEKLVSAFNKLIGPMDSQNTFWDKFANTFAKAIDKIGTAIERVTPLLEKFSTWISSVFGPVDENSMLGRALVQANGRRHPVYSTPDSSAFSKTNAKAQGSAVRQAEVVNSADELQRRMAIQALTAQGMGDQKSEGIQIKIAIDTLHQDVMEIISIIKGKGSEFYDKLNEAYKQAIEQQTRTVVDSFNSLRMS